MQCAMSVGHNEGIFAGNYTSIIMMFLDRYFQNKRTEIILNFHLTFY